MGTNYYAIPPVSPKVEIHLGKYSAGWPFLFRCHDEWTEENAFQEWKATAESYRLKDEYGREVELEELMKWIAHSYETSTLEHWQAFVCEGYQFARGDFC